MNIRKLLRKGIDWLIPSQVSKDKLLVPSIVPTRAGIAYLDIEAFIKEGYQIYHIDSQTEEGKVTTCYSKEKIMEMYKVWQENDCWCPYRNKK